PGHRPGLGVAQRSFLHHSRRRQSARPPHAAPPGAAPRRGTVRGRERGITSRFDPLDGARSSMILTGRSVALIGVGALATVLTRNPWLMLAWTAAVIIAATVDWAFLPRRFTAQRASLPAVRLSQTHAHTIRVTNTSTRRIRGRIRESWQPSAGALRNAHRIVLVHCITRTLNTRIPPRRCQLMTSTRRFLLPRLLI